MFEFRQRGDYEDFVEFSNEEVKCWLDKAKVFIDAVDEILESMNK